MRERERQEKEKENLPKCMRVEATRTKPTRVTSNTPPTHRNQREHRRRINGRFKAERYTRCGNGGFPHGEQIVLRSVELDGVP
jgi:hypothetical protein